jgi:Zn-dependent protease
MPTALFESAYLPLLASFDFHSPILWAIVIGWVLSVTLHELAHGVVAYFGGDYTIRERGGLTLNPFKYMDPLISIIIPLFFLLMGGVPLPGGVTYVRRDLLRSNLWDTAVSLAGPMVNFVLFLVCALPFHPRVGWIHPSADITEWTSTQLFLATMAMLQFEIFVINLMPIPPLDGFGAIKPYFDERSQQMFSSPIVTYGGFFVVSFVVLALVQGIYQQTFKTLGAVGFDGDRIELFRQAFNKVMAGQ